MIFKNEVKQLENVHITKYVTNNTKSETIINKLENYLKPKNGDYLQYSFFSIFFNVTYKHFNLGFLCYILNYGTINFIIFF